MRVGVLSLNNIQLTLMAETLTPVFGQVEMYDLAKINSGEFSQANLHALVVDYSDPAIMDIDEVMEVLDKEEPASILNEAELYPMGGTERIAWRNKIIAEMKKCLPDFSREIHTPEELGAREKLHDLWVMGASSGGPQAIRDFLEYLPALPATIILVQHISLAAFRTFVTRVQEATRIWTVEPACDQMPIKQNSIIVVPQDIYVSVTKGRLNLLPHTSPHTFNPSINANIRSVFKTTPGNLGVIILSGMGDDGAAGIKELQGGAHVVMAQSGESCGARSMPDAARETGAVDLTGTPKELAESMARKYGLFKP